MFLTGSRSDDVINSEANSMDFFTGFPSNSVVWLRLARDWQVQGFILLSVVRGAAP